MDSPCLNLVVFWSFILHSILLSCMNSNPISAATLTFRNESDRVALLAFKDRITRDPNRVMSSWNDSLHFCNWTGVTCSPRNERVTLLKLEGQSLAGSISPSIGNLTFLTKIRLGGNSFHGEIPQEIGYLIRLQYLDLSGNSFKKIPTNLTHCSDLRVLDVSANELVGHIPDQLSSLSKMKFLALQKNNLTGSIPAWIGNFSSLGYLSLGDNNLQGGIPNELGRLWNLSYLILDKNKLSGTIPSSIYNLSSLHSFSFPDNQLQGTFPPDLGHILPNLHFLLAGKNNFTGPIPVSLSNASMLIILDLGENSLTGPVPANFGSLQNLKRLNLGVNQLGNGEAGDLDFLTSLANCSRLEHLVLYHNSLGGELPSSIANLSTQLNVFAASSNLIHGSIPIGIENLVNLTNLMLENNFFTGSVPDGIGKLQNLKRLALNSNRFSRLIPSSLGNLTLLIALLMDVNRLEGSIPPSLGNCTNLLEFNLSRNNLNGTIPEQVIGLSSLSIFFAVAHNSLTGSLPLEVGSLINLGELDVSENKLSGEIPSTLSKCLHLERLHMEGNFFQGTIPQSLSNLKGLQDIDLSRNNLSGQIPDYLGKFSSLKNLNLSFNDFQGEVSNIFANASTISILGNNKLCGGVPELHLPACSRKVPHTQKKFLTSTKGITVAIVVLLVVIMSCFLATFFWIRHSRKRTSATSSSKDWKLGVSYTELFKSTNEFSADNLIGVGSFGCVYKGVRHDNGEIVAVKVLNLQQHEGLKSFIAECKALKNVRHRNLLKIITACSSLDYKGSDFKALVFEFMSNGSLNQWLHPRVDEHHQFKSLNLIQRLNIAIDVASALDYLHHHCHTPIVHCDLKPSNVLLDEDMTAHVGDFGLARFLFETSKDSSKSQTLSNGVKGSIGYVPPEYGMGGQVSLHGDVYSYGILLLEMFTGKRPTDDMFKDGLSIHQYTEMALPEQLMDIVDPSLPLSVEDEEEEEEEEMAIISNEEDHGRNVRSGTLECLLSVLTIGLSCSSTSAKDRMVMSDVVNKMNKIRDSLLRARI